jgi:hypothetical protein
MIADYMIVDFRSIRSVHLVLGEVFRFRAAELRIKVSSSTGADKDLFDSDTPAARDVMRNINFCLFFTYH